MHRDGYLIQEIIERPNLECAFDHVLTGTDRKESSTGKKMLKDRKFYVDLMQQQIADGTWELGELHRKRINERGKIRDIDCAMMFDRMVLNATMNVVEKHLKRRWISTTAASIEGRGGLYLLNKVIKDLHESHAGKIYKWDIHHYYQSILQDFMLWVLNKYFKDKALIAMLTKCIYALPEGISIGLRSSQTFGNMLLDYLIDHYLKDKLGAEFYYRYCDDGLNMDNDDTFYKLTGYSREIKAKIEAAGLKIKPNEQFWNFDDRPIDFLGYVIYANGNIRIRKHIKQRFARRWKRVKSKRRKKELIGSFYGMTKHAHAKHLFKTITGITMRDFKDFGLIYKATDGKKRWDCTTVHLCDLANTTIIVEDFEKDVTVRGNELRHLVKFRFEDGKEGKFFTASEEMKQLLAEIKQIPDGFPFKTTIKRVSFGNGKAKYVFS
jgi:hypothetical protein